MKIGLVKNTNGHFTPAYDSDWEKAKKIKTGDLVTYERKKERNPRFHRKLFALYRLTLHYLPEAKKKEIRKNEFRMQTEEDVLFYCKIKQGLIRNRGVTNKGNIIYEADSISFAKMGEDEFSDFYNRSVDICLALMDADRSLIERELMNFM